MKEILIIKTDGTVERETLTGNGSEQFATIQKVVEGWVERAPLEDYTLLMWVNEEGKLKGLPHNPLAQRLWDKEWGAGTDTIVGNVVITGDDDEEGETGGLPEGVADRLMKTLGVLT